MGNMIISRVENVELSSCLQFLSWPPGGGIVLITVVKVLCFLNLDLSFLLGSFGRVSVLASQSLCVAQDLP